MFDEFENLKKAAAHELQQTAGIGQCTREKYWKECSIEEKIERLRHVMKSQQERITHQDQTIRRLRRKLDRFERHEHNAMLQMVLPVGCEPEEEPSIGHIGRPDSPDPDACYF